MVPDLVCDHVRSGEVSRRAKAPRQLLEEREIEVHLVIGRAVERPGGPRCGPAAAHRARREDHDRRAGVPLARLLEDLRPHVLRVARHELRELERVALRRCRPAGALVSRSGARRRRGNGLVDPAGRQRPAAVSAAEDVPAEEQRQHDDDDQAEPAASDPHRDREASATESTGRLPAAVLDVPLARNLLPAHAGSLPRWRLW